MNIKRKFDGFLSEEHTKGQLICLALLLIVSFFLFWGISELFFHGTFRWQEIIALYLDPGVFGNEVGKYDGFRLLITGVGIFFFTALLVSIFTKIFSNISDAYNKGERRYKNISGHILILGSNRMLIGMLSALRKKTPQPEILIMTSSPIETLRDKVEAFFGDPKFMKRISFYYDERDNERNLRDACADKAKLIYVIGEENEVDHDSVNISCCEKLKKVCESSPSEVHCFLVLSNQSSADVYHYSNENISSSKLRVDVVDIKEYVAQQTLLGLNGANQIPIDGDGITKDSNKHLHFVVAGLTPMGKAMALTAAHLCHFPNFNEKTGANRTTISIAEPCIKEKMDKFISEHSELFKLSHYSVMRYKEDGRHVVHYAPDEKYGDFLDIEWEFIDSDIDSPEVKQDLTAAALDETQQLAIAICQERQEDNTSSGLHLPPELYDKSRKIPIYVHLWEQGNVLNKANETGQFGHIYCFGTGTVADKDPLFEQRLDIGKRVNYVYTKLFSSEETSLLIDEAWYSNSEANKFSSIYSGYSIPVKMRSLGDNFSADLAEACALEHRRWILSELLLGFRAFTVEEREKYKMAVVHELQDKQNLGEGGPDTKKEKTAAWRELKVLKDSQFKHIDIDSYSGLIDDAERYKDKAILVNIPFIINKTEEIVRV